MSDRPYFSSYAEPNEVPVLDYDVLDLSPEETAQVAAIVASHPIAVRAAHVYDRKGFFSTDAFQQPTRHGNGRDTDQIVVQVTMVIRHDRHAPEPHQQMTAIHANVQQAQAEAALVEAEAVHAAQQAAVKAAEDGLAHARAQVERARAAVDNG